MYIDRIILNSLSQKNHYEIKLGPGETLHVAAKPPVNFEESQVVSGPAYIVVDAYKEPSVDADEKSVVFCGGKAEIRFIVRDARNQRCMTLPPAWRRHFHPEFGPSYIKKDGTFVRKPIHQLPIYEGQPDPTEPLYAVYTPGGFVPDAPRGYRLCWVCEKADTTWLYVREDDPRIIE